MLNLFFAQCTDRASFFDWLYLVLVIVQLMKWTGWRPLPSPGIIRFRALHKSWLPLTMIGLAGLKYAIVLSLVMLVFSFSNAPFSSAPHWNFVSL